jgi:hypothetical protein
MGKAAFPAPYANPPVELAAERHAVYDAVMHHVEKTMKP